MLASVLCLTALHWGTRFPSPAEPCQGTDSLALDLVDHKWEGSRQHRGRGILSHSFVVKLEGLIRRRYRKLEGPLSAGTRRRGSGQMGGAS